MNKVIDDIFKNTPEIITSKFEMESPNERIDIYNGTFQLYPNK